MLRQRPVHLRRMPSVEVHRVRVRALVQEIDADAIAFRRADGRTRHLAVVGPRRKEDARRNLDLAIHGDDVVLAQPRAVRPCRLAIVPATAPSGGRAEKFHVRANAPGSKVAVETRPTGPAVVRWHGPRRSGRSRRLASQRGRAGGERGAGAPETGQAHDGAAAEFHAHSLTKIFDYSKYIFETH